MRRSTLDLVYSLNDKVLDGFPTIKVSQSVIVVFCFSYMRTVPQHPANLNVCRLSSSSWRKTLESRECSRWGDLLFIVLFLCVYKMNFIRSTLSCIYLVLQQLPELQPLKVISSVGRSKAPQATSVGSVLPETAERAFFECIVEC